MFLSVAFVLNVNAQSGIGNTSPNVSAKLDVSSTNKGLLIPRVSLSSLTDASTITSPATSLLIYNTNTSTTSTRGAGYYYNAGTSSSPN